jgi:hypothetical protein
VGLVVGVTVGELVGVAVGDEVGVTVGKGDGSEDGDEEGSTVDVAELNIILQLKFEDEPLTSPTTIVKTLSEVV